MTTKAKVFVFSSFGKTTTDFFQKGFPESHKVELTTKAENGLTFTSSAEHKQKKDNQTYVLGKLETKYKWEQVGLDFTGSVDTDNLIKGVLALSDLGLPGLKVQFKPQMGSQPEVNTALEFQNKTLSLATSAMWKPDGDLLLTGAVVVGHSSGTFVGLESSYFVQRKPDKDPRLDGIKGLLNYKGDCLDLTVYAKKQWGVESQKGGTMVDKWLVGSLYEHKAGSSTVLHSTLEWDSSKEGPQAFAFQFGGSHKVDADTSVQAKLGNEGKLTLHLAKQFTPQLKGTVTTEFNTLSLTGTEHKLAWGVNFKA